jgi:hypothetical protein
MLFRRLDVPVTVWRTPSAARRPAPICGPRAGTQTTRYRVVGVICLLRDRRRRGHTSQGRGVIPVASSSRYGSPAPWEIGAGQARLRQLLRCGMMTPVLTNGEASENMAIAAGKGPKTQKIGLKEHAPALVQRISDSASSHIACGSYRSATQGARGRLCRKPAACPCRPFLCPTPSGEERAADAPSSYYAPPDSAVPPVP